MYKVKRYHDISCGHTVYKHEGKCAHLHGHNYRVHFTCQTNKLDSVGRVIDFSVVKEKLCMWLENNWDHKFLVYENDIRKNALVLLDPKGVVVVPFNPTAEKMAEYLVLTIAPELLKETEVALTECVIEETYKCSASFSV